jgi:hypothetical protein
MWALVLPAAGFLAGGLISCVGGTAALFISAGIIITASILSNRLGDRAFARSWFIRAVGWLVLFTPIIGFVLLLSTFLFWWVVPLVQGTRRFDQNEAISALNTWYPLIGVITGVVLSLIALIPAKSGKR